MPYLPKTIQLLKISSSAQTCLDGNDQILFELEQYIQNVYGTLVQQYGNFSQTSRNIYASLNSPSIKLRCQSQYTRPAMGLSINLNKSIRLMMKLNIYKQKLFDLYPPLLYMSSSIILLVQNVQIIVIFYYSGNFFKIRFLQFSLYYKIAKLQKNILFYSSKILSLQTIKFYDQTIKNYSGKSSKTMSEKREVKNKSKKSSFISPKKQPLVRKMIFDAHQVNIPSSCYELRPINQNESNEHEIIFDPKSSSMKQISQFQKNSPHQIDKMINQNMDQNSHNASLFLNVDKQISSPNFGSKSIQNSECFEQSQSPLKRQNPIFSDDMKKYQKLVKIFQIVDEKPLKDSQSNKQKQIKRVCQDEKIEEIVEDDQQSEKSIKISKYMAKKRVHPNKKEGSNTSINKQINQFKTQNLKDTKSQLKCEQEMQIKKSKNRKSRNKQLSQQNQMFKMQKVSSKKSFQPTIKSKKKHTKQKSKAIIIHPLFNSSESPIYEQDIKYEGKNIQQEIYEVKQQAISQQQQQKAYKKQQKARKFRKIADNSQYQLVNQYIQLMSYTSLIQDMIAIYDKSPLFENPLQFDSEEQTENYTESEIRPHEQIVTQSKDKQNRESNVQQQVKVQYQSSIQQQYFISEEQQQQNLARETLNYFQKLRISQAKPQEKKQTIKEIKFQKTKTYTNYYEAIIQLKPYLKKMTVQEKQLFLILKKQLKQIKDIIDHFEKNKSNQNKQHVCKLCGEEFQSGRQLGGHMSRKHPGKAIQYGFKKQLQKVKTIQRNRRRYFKNNKGEVKIEEM